MMEGFIAIFILTLLGTVINFSIFLYSESKCDSETMRHILGMVFSFLIGILQIILIINFLVFIYPVMSGR